MCKRNSATFHLAESAVETIEMLHSERESDVRVAGPSGAEGELPAGWIGARDLPGLTLHLREFVGDAQDPLGDLAEALFAIDDESQALIGAERRRFFEIATGGTARGEVVWGIVRKFLDELFSALSDLVLRDCYAGQQGAFSLAGRAELMARTLRAGAGVVSWDTFRYGPHDDAGWARLGHIFSLAVEGGCAEQDVVLPGAGGRSTTPRREFLHGVAMRCAGFDRLPVEAMDGVDRLIRQILPGLALRRGDSSDALFWLHLGEGAGLRRMTQGMESDPARWFFSPGSVIEGLLAGLPSGGKPGAGITHLRHQWDRQQPVRRHQRHAMQGTLGVVQRWDEMVAFLSGMDDLPVSEVDLADVSRGGLSLRAPAGTVAGARVGDLMGVRTKAGGEWQLGVVRRIRRNRDQSVQLGIETLTRTPVLVEADDGRASAVGVVCDPVRSGATVRFLTPSYSFREGEPVFLKLGATVLKLRPQGDVVRARSCEFQTFQVL
jgi:hypothetical protein